MFRHLGLCVTSVTDRRTDRHIAVSNSAV